MRYAPINTQLCPAPWFPFCMAQYRVKQQSKLLLSIYFIAGFEISTEHVY